MEILTDNGSAYTAKDTRILARQIGLKPCFTPVKSPQSSGISEAFVHTLKRDHPPHSGLRMRSPREFIQAQTATA